MKPIKVGVITSLLVMGLGTVAGCASQQKTSQSSSASAKPVTKAKQKAKIKTSSSTSSVAASQRTGAQSSSHVSSADAASAKRADVKKMNYAQIQAGNYTSLLGTWTEVAEAANHRDGNGTTWGPVSTVNPLTISASELKNEAMTLTANSVVSNGETSAVGYRTAGQVLQADTKAGAIVWNISFYPRGVAITGDFQGTNLPSGLNTGKNRIMIHTSNNDFTEVFIRK